MVLKIKREVETVSIIDDARNQSTIVRLQKGVYNGFVHTSDWVILYWPKDEYSQIGTVVFESKDKEEALREMLDAFGLEES